MFHFFDFTTRKNVSVIDCLRENKNKISVYNMVRFRMGNVSAQRLLLFLCRFVADAVGLGFDDRYF